MFKYFLVVTLSLINLTLHAQTSKRLNTGWEFVKQDLGGVWEAVRPVKAGNPEELPFWNKINLPHCFNATDAVDPNVNYYQGPGWYRTNLEVENPYANGRTLLHFEGAGQKTTIYVYNIKIAEHVGGYDEWTADITDAVAEFKKNPVFQTQFKGKIPVIIRCDNSRDLEMIPSSLSDFNVYGGIYRYLNLVYNPKISFDKLFANASINEVGGYGKLKITARLNQHHQSLNAQVKFNVTDPNG
ncbi:MAG: glycoside hydrolase family 2, partial [Pedobacter sp.]